MGHRRRMTWVRFSWWALVFCVTAAAAGYAVNGLEQRDTFIGWVIVVVSALVGLLSFDHARLAWSQLESDPLTSEQRSQQRHGESKDSAPP